MGFAGALPILLASAHSAETPDSDRTTATNTSNSPRENSGRRFPRRRSTHLSTRTFKLLQAPQATRHVQEGRPHTAEKRSKTPAGHPRNDARNPRQGPLHLVADALHVHRVVAVGAELQRRTARRHRSPRPNLCAHRDYEIHLCGPAAQARIQCRRTIYRACEFFCACNWRAASAFACHCCASALRPRFSSSVA